MTENKAMGITEKENELFARWAREKGYGNLFDKDGAPCPAEFEKAKYRITFVLKEANDFDPDGKEYGKDMRAWINNDGAYGATWKNILRWTQAILENSRDYPEDVDCFETPQKISFINLKKVSGGAQAKPAEIVEYAKNDASFIREQLNIYQPDIIVCCGMDLVADCLANYVFHYEGEWEHDDEQYKICWFYVQLPNKKGETAVLNYYHPLNLGTGCTNKELFDKIFEVSKRVLEG